MTKLYLFIRRYLAVVLVCGSVAAFAQQTVTGKVISSDDQTTIPGVNIVEKGTSNGTVSDAEDQCWQQRNTGFHFCRLCHSGSRRWTTRHN